MMDKVPESEIHGLIGGRLLARNTLWNLIGFAVPLVAAIIVIPVLNRHLGTDRFGVLTLIWAMIGYFNLFDLGIGRALTKLVADRLGSGEESQILQLSSGAFSLMLVLSCLGTLALVLISGWLTVSVLNIPGELQNEATQAFYLCAVAIPLIVISAGISGMLAAAQRFDLINLIRIPLGLFVFIGPLLVLPFSNSLFWMTGILVFGRMVAMAVQAVICLRVFPSLRQRWPLPEMIVIKKLIGFGSWMTVSNIISPVMVSMDRFLVGAFISVTAVAYYATSQEAITKLSFIPSALASTLFPAFSAEFASSPEHTKLIFSRGVKFLFLIQFPLTVIVVAFASEGLRLWLGDEFSRNSTHVLQILALGVFFGGLGGVPFALIQAAGRPDITAKLHMLELPFYLAMASLLIHSYGITGAAIAWTARICLDALLLFFFANRFLTMRWTSLKQVLPATGFGIIALILSFLDFGAFKIILIFLLLSVCLISFWYNFLSHEEKTILTQWKFAGNHKPPS
ncbi:MAG: flippase [Thermoleophilia bacterium]